MIGMQCDKCKTLIDTTVMVNQDGRCFKCGHPYEPILLARWDERQKVLAEIESWLLDEKLTVWKTEPYSKGDKYCCKDGCERCGRVQGIEMGKNELRAELRAKVEEMGGVK